ncbi:MAG: hypothetical protein R3C13_01815 [Hyphomonas sp.]|uniref:hypothetical protein n=1 Tax=Hyphomonas sp. TaxID=87 RepID=UPI0035299F63
MFRFPVSVLAALAGLFAGPALAQASDESNLAVQLKAGETRTIFVSGNGATLPVFSVCLDRVNGKTVYLHIAESSNQLAVGVKQVLPEGGCLFASGRILYLSADEMNKEPGFEGATALITVSLTGH